MIKHFSIQVVLCRSMLINSTHTFVGADGPPTLYKINAAMVRDPHNTSHFKRVQIKHDRVTLNITLYRPQTENKEQREV